MHKARPRAQAPKWRRAELVRSILRPGLDDAVAGPDVVQQKITVGMDYLVAERCRHRKGPAIDRLAGRCRRDGLDMTDIAADPLEQCTPDLGIGSGRQLDITRRGLRPADELSEVVDISQTQT